MFGEEDVECSGDVHKGADEGAEDELVWYGAVGLGGHRGVGGEEGLNAGEIKEG